MVPSNWLNAAQKSLLFAADIVIKFRICRLLETPSEFCSELVHIVVTVAAAIAQIDLIKKLYKVCWRNTLPAGNVKRNNPNDLIAAAIQDNLSPTHPLDLPLSHIFLEDVGIVSPANG